MKVDVVVLGGGDGAVIDPECRFKGLVPVAGKPLMTWVGAALRSAELVAEVAAVVPTAEGLGPWTGLFDKLVISDRSFMQNVIAGVSAFREDRPVLVATGDLPLLDAAAIDDFIGRSLETGADFTYPFVPRADMEAQYPGTVRTYVKVDGTQVTGGNMMLVNPRLVQNNGEIGQSLFGARKNSFDLARILGFRFVLHYVTGRLTVPELEAKLTQLLGGPSRAIRTTHASIGVDVDKPADVELAESVLSIRA